MTRPVEYVVIIAAMTWLAYASGTVDNLLGVVAR